MSDGFALDEFLASQEANGLSQVDAGDRREIAVRLHHALGEVGRPLKALSSGDLHGWLFHAIPERFEPGEPLAAHVPAVLRALAAFVARTSGEKLTRLRGEIEESLHELGHALEHGHSHGHGHHHHHDEDDEPQEPFVRAQPKVGRNDPCPCGSGKKFKKCHGGAA